MIRIADLKLPLGRDESLLKKRAAKQLHIPVEQITSWRIFKKSLDARKKDRIHYVCVVDVAVDNETKVLAGVKGDKNVSKTPDLSYHFPEGKCQMEKRPVVVGFGPAGDAAGCRGR